MNQKPQEAGKTWPHRWVELLMAMALLGLAGLVIVDSLRLGIGWADDGPRSGYFPFRIGVGLALCSGWLAVKQLLAWRASMQAFATREQLRDVLAVLLPTLAYVALIPWLGIYLPSALLIAWFMWRSREDGGYRWWTVLGTSSAVSLVLFVVFERWFMQPLPKGPLEHWLGY